MIATIIAVLVAAALVILAAYRIGRKLDNQMDDLMKRHDENYRYPKQP